MIPHLRMSSGVGWLFFMLNSFKRGIRYLMLWALTAPNSAFIPKSLIWQESTRTISSFPNKPLSIM